MIAMILVKLYTCQFNSSKIKSFFDYLHSDWMKLECAEEYEIMETYAKRANLISLIYCLYYYISGAVFILISLVPHIANLVLPVNESWPIFMPYEAYYFVDGEKYFFYIFFHILVSLEICIAGVMAHDCMFLTFIEHVCSVFAVAGFRFETLVRNDSDHVEKNRLNDKYNRKIAVSVHAHWQALHLAEFLERTFRVALAIQVLIVTLALSITLLQIVLRLNEIAEVVRYMAYVICQVINLLCISVQSQKLIDHSVQIRDKVYNSSWYKLPTKSQKMLLSVMRRSLQPNFLSAGKIYVFSLKSFTTVKIIYKYYIIMTCLFKIPLRNF
ncbi:hypothetical protein P5V15_008476 [Pogonomyrmex californicus]